MKKTLLFKGILFLSVLILSQAQNLTGQVILYESFDYTVPGYVGGNGAVGTSSNNWTTHSVTTGQTTTIDLYTGSLSYTGIISPAGNRVLLPGTNSTVSRDVNRAITTTSTTVYYSAFIKVIDNTQLSSTTTDYFISLGATAGGTSIASLGARLGIKSVNTGANYRLLIQNTTGGTPTYTEFAQDLNFGTTYLVVLKYDRLANPTVASLWVNPSELGGTEPAGSVSNSSGTSTFTAFASICLRNSSNTPKVEIDEIRVGVSYADVTPMAADADPPVATFTPANSATDVLKWVKPAISFNEAIKKTDASAVTDADLSTLITFKKTDVSGADVPFTATIDATKKLITVNPSSNLDNSQLYYLAVGPVEDISGNESLLKSVTFTTIAAATPVITLTYPTGGERFYEGQPVTVTWNSANITNVFVEVWAPDGTTGVYSWIPFVASTPGADGHADSSVPVTAPYGTEYKIRVSDLSNAAVNSTGGNFTVIGVATTLADLRTRFKANDIVKYTGTATVTYARTSNSQKYIQDATGAILIHDPSGLISGTYIIGDGITNIEGIYTLYYGLLELVPQTATGATATGTAIVPPVVDITTLTSADQCKLVKIQNLKFATPTQWDATGKYVASKNYDLSGLSNVTYAYRTAFSESDYIGTAVPAESFDAVVLVGQFNAQIQVTARNLADITIIPTGIDGTTEDNIQVYPVPASTELNISNMVNVKNIEILDVTGKVMLKLDTDGQNEVKIPIANFARGMYFIKFTTEKGTVIKRFIKS
jgi:hypothetical protein